MPLVNGTFRESLTDDFYNSAYAQETSAVFLYLLDFSIIDPEGDGTPTVYHYVNDYTPLTYNDGVNPSIIYQPASFKISLGSDSADSTPKVTLTFDSGDRTIIRRLRETDFPPECSISVAISPQDINSVIDHRELGPIRLIASDFSFKATAVNINLIVEPILNEPIPTSTMNPKLAPLLWADIPI